MLATRCIFTFVFVLLACPFAVRAAGTTTLPTTRTVGVGKQYSLPSQAIAAANDGDTILIDSGTYTDDFATIAASDVVLKGNGGKARLVQATSTAPNGKAIWIAAGNNITVDSVEFAGARATNGNVAGILDQGAGLTVRNSYFHDDQNGIVVQNGSTTDVVIDNTEFARDGNGVGSGNALNIGVVRTFTLRYSYLHDQNTGDVVKTRALKNIIAYNRITGENGTENCEINVPQGGETYIAGTVLQKAISSLNSTLITYGQEGALNPSQSFNMMNNTLVNDRSSDLYILVGNTSASARIVDNLFVGSGTLVSGATLAGGNVVTESPAFVDKANYDYHLTAGSPAIDKGVSPGSVNGINLAVGTEYVHPLSSKPRVAVGAIDAGAFEYAPSASPSPSPSPAPGTSTSVTLRATPATIQRGQSTLLTWNSNPPASCSSNDFFANGALGSVSVSPASTTVYTVFCGDSSAQAQVTVTIPALFSRGNIVGLASNASVWLRAAPTQNSASLGLITQGNAGTVIDGPVLAEGTNWFKVQYVFVRYGSISGWMRQDDLAATSSISMPLIALNVLPTTVSPGARAFISWSAPNATSCRGDTISISSTSGTIVVTPYQTSTYTVLCDNSAASTTVYVANSPAPVPTPTPTTPVPVPVPTPTPNISQVVTTDVLNVRSSPSVSAPVVCAQPQGTLGTKVAGPVSLGGHVWWGINYAQGCDGWSAGEYLIAPGSAPAAPAVRFDRPLSVGSRGADVTELQNILKDMGYFSGDSTGYFGPITRAAVMRYQEHAGLEAVGSVGPKTRLLLNQVEAGRQ